MFSKVLKQSHKRDLHAVFGVCVEHSQSTTKTTNKHRMLRKYAGQRSSFTISGYLREEMNATLTRQWRRWRRWAFRFHTLKARKNSKDFRKTKEWLSWEDQLVSSAKKEKNVYSNMFKHKANADPKIRRYNWWDKSTCRHKSMFSPSAPYVYLFCAGVHAWHEYLMCIGWLSSELIFLVAPRLLGIAQVSTSPTFVGTTWWQPILRVSFPNVFAVSSFIALIVCLLSSCPLVPFAFESPSWSFSLSLFPSFRLVLAHYLVADPPFLRILFFPAHPWRPAMTKTKAHREETH